jgi:hypothetical protein
MLCRQSAVSIAVRQVRDTRQDADDGNMFAWIEHDALNERAYQLLTALKRLGPLQLVKAFTDRHAIALHVMPARLGLLFACELAAGILGYLKRRRALVGQFRLLGGIERRINRAR